MEYFRSLICSGGASEEEKMEGLEESRWNKFEKRRRSRSIALRKKYRKEVKEREAFLERMKKSPILDQVAWDRVALFVKEPKDLVNMWGMCEPWRKSVKLRITTSLFSEVFPKLVEGGILSTSDVLNCRSVCKTWRDSVDSYMITQQLWKKREIGAFNPFTVKVPSPRLSINLYGTRDYDIARVSLNAIGILRKIRGDEGGPPGTTKLLVRIAGNPLNAENPFRLEDNQSSLMIAGLLSFFWKVTHLHVECEHENQPEVFLIYLISILVHLKYVETIVVRGTRIGNQHVEVIEWLLKEHPFPVLKRLRTIVASSLHPLIIAGMLKIYGSKLETLVIENGSYEMMKIIEKGKLIRLKRMDFQSQRYYEPVNSIDGLSLKTSLLEEIDLRFIQISKLDIARLISSFNKFGKTLKKLQLTLQTRDEQALSFSTSLQLPVLEKLRLTINGIYLENIDFLIPSARLKELDLTEVINWRKKISNYEKSEHIKFSRYKNRLYESNIWRMFPELKNVRIKVIIKNVYDVVDKNVARVFVYDRFEFTQFLNKNGRQ